MLGTNNNKSTQSHPTVLSDATTWIAVGVGVAGTVDALIITPIFGQSVFVTIFESFSK